MSPGNRYADKWLAGMERGVKRESSADTSAAHKAARQAPASGALALDPSIPHGHSELTTATRKEAREEIEIEPIAPVDEAIKVVPQLLATDPDRHATEVQDLRLSFACALDGCEHLASFQWSDRRPYTRERKYFCCSAHLTRYVESETDGTVQEEVSDEWQTVSTHGGESQAAQLVRERYATWAKRARKWHAYLERERAWSTHGRLLSVLTGAASTLAAATVAPHYAHLVVGALMIATALIAWRGQVAQSRLESSRAADAWAAADRLAEVYKGLVVELDAVITTCDDFMKREQAEQVLAKSQQIEGAARFGVPEGLRSVLVEVCK